MFTRLARFVERHPRVHGASLRVWRLFLPRLAGFQKGLLARRSDRSGSMRFDLLRAIRTADYSRIAPW